LDFQPVGDVVHHPAVRQQPEVLEHHADPVPAQLPELGGGHLPYVLATDGDLARRRLDEPREAADQCRLAAARQAHDDEDLARPDFERDVPDGGGASGLRPELGGLKVGVGASDDAVCLGAEDLPEPANFDRGCAHSESPHLAVSP
jgi:hypothetical protein